MRRVSFGIDAGNDTGNVTGIIAYIEKKYKDF